MIRKFLDGFSGSNDVWVRFYEEEAQKEKQHLARMREFYRRMDYTPEHPEWKFSEEVSAKLIKTRQVLAAMARDGVL